jgi:hypothetical protein
LDLLAAVGQRKRQRTIDQNFHAQKPDCGCSGFISCNTLGIVKRTALTLPDCLKFVSK